MEMPKLFEWPLKYNDVDEQEAHHLDDWLDLTNELTDKMKNNTEWKAKVRNFGWHESDGEKKFEAETGQSLLREILPDTDCSFIIYKYGEGFAIQNFHHDSPTGKEWYYVLPNKEEENV